MLVLLVPIVLIAWFFTTDPAEPNVETVDWRSASEVAAREAPFAVEVPADVPVSWRATRARWTPAGNPGVDGEPVAGDLWQLGFVDDRPMYIGLDQSTAPKAVFIADVTREGTAQGSSAVGERSWTRYVSEDSRTHALVWIDGDVTVIVSGDVPFDELESFAATLTPAG